MYADYVVIGGGVVGLSLAWGLLREDKRVILLDGSDGDHRASRGNFGLVWVQSKGIDAPHYARWSIRSAKAWRGFADELSSVSGHPIALEQNGGWDFHFDEAALEERIADYKNLSSELGGDYPYEVIRGNTLRKHEPYIGDKVKAGILHEYDGHTNPLSLMRALTSAVLREGGNILTNKEVTAVSENRQVTCADGSVFSGDKIILSAGLGAMKLGPKLGFKNVIRPQRGQVLITEKLPKIINRPSLIARQVDEGGIQIGASNEEVGLNDDIEIGVLAQLAQTAIETYPILQKANLIRSWGALRVLSPDGLPIYQESHKIPNVFWVTCHSGITLAANHALDMPAWFEKRVDAPNLEAFSEDRF